MEIVDGLYRYLERLGVKGHTVSYGGALLFVSCQDPIEREWLWMRLRDGWYGVPVELRERDVVE